MVGKYFKNIEFRNLIHVIWSILTEDIKEMEKTENKRKRKRKIDDVINDVTAFNLSKRQRTADSILLIPGVSSHQLHRRFIPLNPYRLLFISPLETQLETPRGRPISSPKSAAAAAVFRASRPP